MAKHPKSNLVSVDISDISEFASVLFSINMVLILFGLPIALTGIGDLGTPEGSDWWSIFLIFAGVSAFLLWLVSGYNKAYWLLWLFYSLMLLVASVVKILSYLWAGEFLDFFGGVFIGVLPIVFLFMAFSGCIVLLTSRIDPFDAKATRVLRNTHRIFHYGRKAGVGGLNQAGRLTALAGVLGMFAFPIALSLSSLGKLGILPELAATNYLVVALFAFPVFGVMIFFGRRLMQPAAHAGAVETDGLPVLLLRAFEDDERQISRKIDLSTILFFGYKNNIRLEEAIAEELWQIGPFYGVGRPGEALPQLGASKAYFDDSQWQEQVISWIDGSQLIVVIAGRSDWLKWEVAQVIKHGAMHKLMVLIPPDEQGNGKERWKYVTQWLNQTPYHAALSKADPKKVRAIYFKPKGEVRAVVSKDNDQTDYELAVRIAAYDMLRTEAAGSHP